MDCIDEDEELRQQLADVLRGVGMPVENADKIAHWKPYDQLSTSGWFDPEIMFGVKGGYDIVIGNPPYIPLQKNQGELADRYAKEGYHTFSRKGDIYQLFYENGYKLADCSGGVLSFISSNSWLKTDYGGATRQWFTDKSNVLRLLDLGNGVFQNAIVDTCILLVRRDNGDDRALTFAMDRDPSVDFPPALNLWGDLRASGKEKWIILPRAEQRIADKAFDVGTPLAQWPVKINTGIKTGENPAFVIDEDTRNRLIERDPFADSIIKPLLRGKDVRRFWSHSAGIYLIDTHNGYGNFPPIDISRHPQVKTHLDRFLPRLKARQDKGISIYNLRSCAYYEDFKSEKIFWRRVAYEGMFSYVADESFCLNAAIMISGKSLKFLCGVLNSKFVTWLMHPQLPTSGTGTFQWEKLHVEKVPVPLIPGTDQHDLVNLVENIIDKKKADPSADTRILEADVDQIVYGYYGSTGKEISTVERYFS